MKVSSSLVRWVRPLQRGPGGGPCIVCCPHAGAGISPFYSWLAFLPPEWSLSVIRLPGRDDRFSEPFAADYAAVVSSVASALVSHVDGRMYTLFGHSMGAQIVLDTAIEMRRLTDREPALLVVSGRLPPQRSRATGESTVHRFEASIRQRMATLEAPEPPNRTGVDELVDYFVALLRADVKLLNDARPTLPEPRLSCAVLALAGTEETELTDEDLASWREITNGPFASVRLPGGHMYLENESSLQDMLQVLAKATFEASSR